MINVVDEEMIPDIKHIVFRKCTPAWEMPENRLDACNLTYLIQGEARYTINEQTCELTQGNLLVLSRGSIRRGITFPNRLMHCFSVDFLLKNASGRDIPPPFPLHSLPGRHEDIIYLFHELSYAWLNKFPGYVIKSRGLFLQILYRFLELVVYKVNSNTGDSRINKVIRYVSTHYSEHITVKLMAEMVGLNPTYFGTLFRQTTGSSFNRHLLHTRIKHAENMLGSGEYKVADVAEVCGFTDVSHFYKQYKLIKGFPPSHSLPKKF